MKIELKLREKTVDIQIKRGMFQEIKVWLPKVYEGKRVFVLTDENVDAYYGEQLMQQLQEGGYQAHKMVVEAGEKTKSLSVVEEVYQELLSHHMTRRDLLLNLGGGVIGDLGGFAAATYLRGIPYVQIPTTLLAQVDSSVGGKVGINLLAGKNLVGSFYHPEAVWIDQTLLETLPHEEFRCGMAEVIKYGCIDDAPLLGLVHDYYDHQQDREKILQEIISRSVAQKVDVVSQDEKEKGHRKLLNFGHTLGHAIEKNVGYGRLSHGEAVAIGMANFTRMSEKMNISSFSTSQALLDVLHKAGLPTEIPPGLHKKALMDAISRDKKMNEATLSIVLLKRIGHAFVKEINRKDVEKYIFWEDE